MSRNHQTPHEHRCGYLVEYSEPKYETSGYAQAVSEPKYETSGYAQAVPSSQLSVRSSPMESRQVERSARSSYNDDYGRGYTKVTESYKAQDSGAKGYKQEAKYTYTGKYVDKDAGCTTEYQTQVKFQKSVYPNKSSSSSSNSKGNNNRINYY